MLPLALLLSAASADPNIIIFGGGWGPEGTQASIEAHVIALSRALAPSKPMLLFAGDADVRSVQIASEENDEVDQILGTLFDRREHLGVTYRKKRIASASATRSALLAAIADRRGPNGLIVFGAGHGSPAEGKETATLDLWGPDNQLSVGELAAELDRSPKNGPIAFVLGHCHSGAFADLIYVGGRAPELASNRCVLAAVPRDREASGCTPDLGDPTADAYLASIARGFEERVDFDGNGRTSLAEAHAHARIRDATVDVPVASSEVFLGARLASRLPSAAHVQLPSLIAKARPSDRAVLEQIDEGRLLRAGTRAVAKEFDELDRRIAEMTKELDVVLDARDRTRRSLVDAVLNRWPELVNPFHHVARELLANDATEVIDFVRARPEWREILARDQEIDARDRQLFSSEKRAAVLERFLRTVQVIAGERLLSARDRSSFAALVQCEALEPKIR